MTTFSTSPASDVTIRTPRRQTWGEGVGAPVPPSSEGHLIRAVATLLSGVDPPTVKEGKAYEVAVQRLRIIADEIDPPVTVESLQNELRAAKITINSLRARLVKHGETFEDS